LILIGGLNTWKAYSEGEVKYKGSTIRSRRSTGIDILILYVSLLYDSLLAFHMNSGIRDLCTRTKGCVWSRHFTMASTLLLLCYILMSWIVTNQIELILNTLNGIVPTDSVFINPVLNALFMHILFIAYYKKCEYDALIVEDNVIK